MTKRRLLTCISVAALAALVVVLPASAKSSKAKNDRDRMPNGWEKKHGLNVRANDASLDPDSDELKNLAEFKNKTDPQEADSDGDGYYDGAEVADGYDPTDPLDNVDLEGSDLPTIEAPEGDDSVDDHEDEEDHGDEE